MRQLAERKGGSMFLCVFLVRICVTIASVNASYLRRAVGLNQPEQHIYATSDKKTVLLDLEYDKAEQRAFFNQAQRSYDDVSGSMPFALASFAFAAYAFP